MVSPEAGGEKGAKVAGKKGSKKVAPEEQRDVCGFGAEASE